MEPIVTYTREEVAEILKVSLSTVGILLRAKKIFHITAGRQIRVPEQALKDYLAGIKPVWPDAMSASDGEPAPTPSMLEGL